MEQTYEVLRARNPWWEGGAVSSELAPPSRRPEFGRLLAELDERRITTINGPRRVGKTTLMHQLVDHLLRSSVDPRRILYASLDDPAIEYQQGFLPELLETYQAIVLKADLSKIDGRAYFFLDEVHHIEGWERWLKAWQDRRLPVKFVVTGSSSVLLERGLRRLLVGRSLEFDLGPMDPWGYLSLSAAREGLDVAALDALGRRMGEAMHDVAALHRCLSEGLPVLEANRLLAERCLLEFLRRGGFPEGFETPDLARWYGKLVSDVLRKAVYEDISPSHGVRAPQNLERLLLLIAREHGQTFSHASLSRNLGIDKGSLSAYLAHLEEASLVTESTMYAPSMEKRLRANRKLYVSDPGLRNALLLDLDVLGTPAAVMVVEGAVHEVCRRLFGRAHYWRSESRYEVDVVVEPRGRPPLPIEVKWQGAVRGDDLRSVRRFMDEHGSDQAIVVTRDQLELRDGVLLVPARALLLAH